MQKIKNLLTIWLCKVVYFIVRLRGSHGAALPGLIAEKINPALIHMITDLAEGVIVVSGTNGKTTSTHLLASSLKKMGKRVFTNHSGSNMTRGLLASIVRYSTWSGKLNYDVAVLEIDEAYAALLAPILKPRAALLTNVLRDQLDRFGEIDATAKLLHTLAKGTSELVVYNGADRRLQSTNTILSPQTKAIIFGFDSSLSIHFPDDDALYSGKFSSVNADYELRSYKEGLAYIATPQGEVELDATTLQGWHNLLNLTAVVAVVTELYGRQNKAIFDALSPPYGRGEVLRYKDKNLILQLVKNPGGFRIAMEVGENHPALIVINDRIADGRDVSWLWDVDVSSMASRRFVSTAGSRAYDMANRLHYSDIEPRSITIQVEEALDQFVTDLGSEDTGVIFLTYTAMLETRKYIKKVSRER